MTWSLHTRRTLMMEGTFISAYVEHHNRIIYLCPPATGAVDIARMYAYGSAACN
jgi:hypothetical protein